MAKESFIGLGADTPTVAEANMEIACIRGHGNISTRFDSANLSVAEVVADPSVNVELEVIGQAMATWVKGLMGVLPTRHKLVISLRFGIGEGNPEPLTQEATSELLGVEKSRISQIEAASLVKMKRAVWKQKGEAHAISYAHERNLSETARAIQGLILDPQWARAEGRVE
jgi:predicted nucleic acid-binding protein